MTKKENRGGKRAGAGAPTHSKLGKKIKRAYSLSPDVIAILDANRPASKTIEDAVREYASGRNLPTSIDDPDV